MTTSATTVSASATTTSVWMRGAVLQMMLSQGFQHSQISTITDVYTKGTKRIEISWGQVVTSASLQEGKASPRVLPMGAAAKLQKITTWSGHKTMTDSQKWSASDLFFWVDGAKVKATKAELARVEFKVITPKV